MPNIYRGEIRDDGRMVATVNKESLAERVAMDVRDPPGLEWGYGGRGSEQLAEAVLTHEFNDRFASEWSVQFEREFIDDLVVGDEWTVRGDELLDYIPDFDPDPEDREAVFENLIEAHSLINESLQNNRRNLYPEELKAMMEAEERIRYMAMKMEEEFTQVE